MSQSTVSLPTVSEAPTSKGVRIVPLTCNVQEAYDGCEKSVTLVRSIYTEGSDEPTKEEKNVKITISPRTPNGTRWNMLDMGDRYANGITDDVIIELQYETPQGFAVINGNIVIRKPISLYECLTGVNFTLSFLDGKEYTIGYPQDRLPCRPGARTIHQGLGFAANSALIVEYEVVFPQDSFPEELVEAIKSIWPKAPPTGVPAVTPEEDDDESKDDEEDDDDDVPN